MEGALLVIIWRLIMMNLKFNLQFFGGGSSTTRIPKRDPEPSELTNLRNALYSKILPTVENYDANAWTKAQQTANKALDMQQNLLQQATNATNNLQSSLNQNQNQIQQSINGNQNLLNEMLGVVRSGNVPSTLTNNLNASVNKELQGSMGNMLNSLANRGVVNSSITQKGINNLSQQAADAFNRNYLSAFNSVLSGYGQGLQAAQGNTAMMLEANNAQNSLASQIPAMLLQVANQYGSIPTQAYQGAGAALSPAYNMWQTWQQSYDNSDPYDTIVKQGK